MIELDNVNDIEGLKLDETDRLHKAITDACQTTA